MKTYPVTIEIPKGDDRRRHINYEKTGYTDLGPIKDVIPVNEGVMPVHYGFIPNTSGTKEGDDVDILFLSDRVTEVGKTYTGKPVALLEREDQDNKVVMVEPDSNITKWNLISLPLRNLLQDYFGYNSPIVAAHDGSAAIDYIERCSSGGQHE